MSWCSGSRYVRTIVYKLTNNVDKHVYICSTTNPNLDLVLRSHIRKGKSSMKVKFREFASQDDLDHSFFFNYDFKRTKWFIVALKAAPWCQSMADMKSVEQEERQLYIEKHDPFVSFCYSKSK